MLMVGARGAKVEADLLDGRLRCPSCEAQLRPWGHARERVVRGVGRLRPRRSRVPGMRAHACVVAGGLSVASP